MFVQKKKYYFFIESTKDINLENLKKRNKFTIIYRNQTKLEKKEDLLRFRKKCRSKAIDFYIANDLNLATKLFSDGIYLSAHNRSFKALSYKKSKFHVIGSAHSQKEIFLKKKQGCIFIIFSKLFIVDYNKSAPYLGLIKFNNLLKIYKNLIPLGGINLNNLNNLNLVNCKGFVSKSEIKKKPTNFISRLF